MGTTGAHLAKAALAEHHQEVEVSQLHAILVAVGVEPGCGVGRLALSVLARADLRPLDEEEETGEQFTHGLQAGESLETVNNSSVLA